MYCTFIYAFANMSTFLFQTKAVNGPQLTNVLPYFNHHNDIALCGAAAEDTRAGIEATRADQVERHEAAIMGRTLQRSKKPPW